MNILLIGATGATGKDLLELLVNDESIKRIDIFVRRGLNIQHDKLHIHIIDFDKPEQWKYLVKGDVLFSCLGTTLKAAGSKEGQKKVDYYYQYQFAKAAKENNVNSYVLVSSEYASTKSAFFYSRLKGHLEEDVKALNFHRLIIFNPLILLRKGSNRKAEVITTKILKCLNSFGILKSSKPLATDLLAKAMLNSVKTLGDGIQSIKGQKIMDYISLVSGKN
jgi:uncharacterized protein YbjT (DUF2867 family)